ncbi:hypothetical protein [Flavobacterium sp. CF136]|uniref:hypothetical protein n=1 Tax=Flavobacterium sp. (strain CF136) TaxID=1144313 RepID=UPI0002715B48|nr:hypothetical protein [Flavobacterium sp. CF136]EJL62014.1 hypothetical protein PMI10_03106 [Flavobacterium sp. CF136]
MKKTIVLKYVILLYLFIGCKNHESNTNDDKIASNEINLKNNDQKEKIEENVSLDGKWEWTYNPNNEDVPDMLFTLSIQKTNDNEFIAQYCAIAQKGNRIDCSNEKEYNVKGTIKGNKVEATFYSFFDNKKTKANVELLILNKDSIQWQITKQVNFEFYAPTKCILTKKKKKVSQNSILKKNSLPFDFDNYNKVTDKNVYKVYNPDELPQITKIINDQLNEYPSRLFLIDNGGLPFDTYVFETDGDSVTQILVNIKDDKVLSKEIVGYESDSKNTFVINKDLSITMYKVDSDKNSKSITRTLKIKQDGTIVKVK